MLTTALLPALLLFPQDSRPASQPTKKQPTQKQPTQKPAVAETSAIWQRHPKCHDHTGIRWVLPFKKALAHAKKTKRLLMIKPVAFGTDAAGGW